ncbi:YgaP family membrane protein [Phreatobacter sp.]|uniref:YgaP family membrane protein n=1 Tax=Phreatobacter sp. TaxID=1966341 RepID=UPI003F71C33B
MQNVGGADRLARIVLGLVLLVAPFLPPVAAALSGLGTFLWVVPIIGIVMVLTALFRFCPAYTFFGINTCRR